MSMDPILSKIKNYIEHDKNLLEKDTYNNSFLHILTETSYKEQAVHFIPLLLEKGLSVNIKGHLDKTPLYTATEHANKSVIALLLTHKANPNCTDRLGFWTPLHKICSLSDQIDESSSISIINILIQHRADVNLSIVETPLHVACRFSGKSIKIIETLLSAKATVHSTTKYKKNGGDLCNNLHDNKTALELAQIHNKQEVVQLLKKWENK